MSDDLFEQNSATSALSAVEDSAENPHLMSDSQFLLKFPELKPPAFAREAFRTKDEKDRYTAERLKRDRRDVYDYIVKALADPRMSYRRISEITGAKHYILKAIEWGEGSAIRQNRQVLSAKWATVSEMAAEQLMEIIPNAKVAQLGQLAMTGGIAGTKHMELAGDAVVKIDITHKVDFNAKIDNAFNKIMDAVAKAKPIRATVIEPEGLPVG